ncbi:MAG: hypothetical protein A2117_01830 [Candidatus Wildermuthbacteria bacterium GWA2_46_15]|uniref:Uncharacterized protein n=1 Tax=Candidatus Wildermuthbacteria bacterium GWA2_46_15 TaxID=1802443 RepID=A0A1G2QMH5_9BACT|nr:MAG: hypothetical protein A2117_01830 [Candidatus Wildermuthbacteria bacterium GWA2_46_15]
MKILWLEKWWGITVLGAPIGVWRGCSGCRYADGDMAVNMRETDIVTDLGLEHADIDGIHYRWQVHDLPAGAVATA